MENQTGGRVAPSNRSIICEPDEISCSKSRNPSLFQYTFQYPYILKKRHSINTSSLSSTLLQSQIFYVYILCVTWRTKIPNKSKRETYTKSSLMIRKLKNRYILLQASHSNGIERPVSSSSLLHSSPFVLAFSRARFLIPVKARRRGGRKMTVRSRIEE